MSADRFPDGEVVSDTAHRGYCSCGVRLEFDPEMGHPSCPDWTLGGLHTWTWTNEEEVGS